MKTSRLFIQKSALSLTVKFYVEKGIVEKISLSNHPYEGIQWQMYSDEINSEVENQIDEWIKEYGVGKEPKISLPLPLNRFTSYTNNVLAALYQVPFGATLSYQGLAQITGRPKAARAVGNVCRNNPCPLVIPCHRVLTSNNTLGGFSQGLDIKVKLLEFEKLQESKDVSSSKVI
jgi:methylated-DNA-[protein]-cysteine S-methyltransferase